jgi:nanoRNase/pAp phosphatase (c-di-AMP/oligoRNAs hydrolase)
VALTVVPDNWTDAEDFPEHTSSTFQWARAWLASNGFTIDEVRRAMLEMDPLLTRRILKSVLKQNKQVEDMYLRMIEQEELRGNMPAEELERKKALFGVA